MLLIEREKIVSVLEKERKESVTCKKSFSILFLLFDLSYWWKLNVTRRIARFFYRLKYHPSNDTVHLLLFRKKHTVKKLLSGLGDFSKTNHHHVPEATNYDSSDFSELPF